MLANYFTTRLLIPHIYDVCLVDVTDEATEIGVVRDGSLQYSTHSAFGRASIAREVASVTNVPLQEAFNSFPSTKAIQANEDLQTIFTNYTDKIKQLFKETGDRLTIPKNIYVEIDPSVAAACIPHIQQAAEAASKGRVQITNIKEALYHHTERTTNDIPLLVAASFFHTSGTRSHFEYL